MDRLLPRHEVSPYRATIEWNVPARRRLGRKSAERWIEVEIVNLSLQGALVEVPIEVQNEVDDVVTLKLDDATGRARIAHRKTSKDGSVRTYGLQWIESGEFSRKIGRAVGRLRGDSKATRASLEEWGS